MKRAALPTAQHPRAEDAEQGGQQGDRREHGEHDRQGRGDREAAQEVDLNRKKAAYERFGVPAYWIVNPDPPEPELTVFGLRDGCYALAAKA
jgi:hypothetical protein